MQTPTEKNTCFSTLPTAGKLAAFRDWLNDHKALDVTVLDLAGSGAFAEGMIVATATSVRHAQSLADGIALYCRERNFEYLRMEGYAAGQWILVDCNDVVMHIFQSSTRALYNIENLWGAVASARALRQEG